jgi:hypothetical protein
MRPIRAHLSYANVISTLCLFLLLTGGTAVALSGSNTVFTDDIANDTVPASGGNPAGGLAAADLRPNAVGTSEVANESLTNADVKNFSLGNGDFLTGSVDTRVATNNSLTGDDVNEASLGQVPSALLGGSGRWGTNDNQCNPTSTQFEVCAVVTHTLPAEARLLLIAQAKGVLATGSAAQGKCRIGTTAGPLLDTETIVTVTSGAGSENVSLVGVTEPFPPGQHSFGIDCNNNGSGQIIFADAGIAAVALSPG